MKRTLSVLFAVAVLVGLVAGCSTDTDAPDDAAPVSTTTPVTDTSDVSTPPTLPPGYAPPVGELTSETVDLSPVCADAVAPIRELAEQFESGLLLDEAGNATLNAALAAGRAGCPVDEWALYQSDELNGWMNAATSVPEQPVDDAESVDDTVESADD